MIEGVVGREREREKEWGEDQSQHSLRDGRRCLGKNRTQWHNTQQHTTTHVNTQHTDIATYRLNPPSGPNSVRVCIRDTTKKLKCADNSNNTLTINCTNLLFITI